MSSFLTPEGNGKFGVFFTQWLLDFLERPNIKSSFLARAICIDCRIETTLRRGHVAQDKIEDLVGNTRVDGFAGDAIGAQVGTSELGLVV